MTFFFVGQQTILGQSLLILGVSPSHSDTPRSVGLLRMSDRQGRETSTGHRQHSRVTVIHAPGAIQIRSTSKSSAVADPRLSLRGHGNRPVLMIRGIMSTPVCN